MSHRPRRSANTRQHRALGFALFVALLLVCAFRFSAPKDFEHLTAKIPSIPTHPGSAFRGHAPLSKDGLRIAKASMHYGTSNELLEKAIASHTKHNELHGYPMAILRYSVTNGYWNKLSYLLSLVVLELGRPEPERIQWIMWTDADVVLLNPYIPLSTFLPPSDYQFNNINFIGSRVDGELNSRAFFLRVSPWSVHFLVKAMAVPMIDEQAELGTIMDQNAMAFILNETEFRDSAIYQPRTWYNTKQRIEGFEGKMGSILAEFPPALNGERWKQLDECLGDVQAKKWEVHLDKTFYPDEVLAFWDRARQGMATVYKANQIAKKHKAHSNEEFKYVIQRLREVIYWELDIDGPVQEAIKRVEEVMANLVTAQ